MPVHHNASDLLNADGSYNVVRIIAAYDRRAALAKSDPLLALAYWVEAAADRRIETDVCAMSLLTDMRDRARKAIERATGETGNALYPERRS